MGIESTIVGMTTNEAIILRPGRITAEQISAVIGDVQYAKEGGDIVAPGMLTSHYAPDHSITLNAQQVGEDELLLAFGSAIRGNAKHMLNLSETANLEEAAANLFRMLRELDKMAGKNIAIMPIPMQGLGIAINDRLKRAAAPKS